MCGRELIGYPLRNGQIRYTDWGQLSIEIVLGLFNPKRPNCNRGRKIDISRRRYKQPSIKQQLITAINNDVKGEVTAETYAMLGDSDCSWIIENGKHLLNARRGGHYLRY